MEKFAMRFLVVVLAATLTLASCTQHSAPEVGYYNGQKLQIRAEVEAGAFNGVLKLYIDEELTVDQRSKTFGGSSQSFTGKWKGRNVVARVTYVQNLFSAYHLIDVFIEGQLVETLTI